MKTLKSFSYRFGWLLCTFQILFT